MRTFNLIYYFIICLMFISCGESGEKEQETEPAEITGSAEENEQEESGKTILFFGNSLTAGLGLDTSEAYPAIIQEKIDSLGLNYEVINAGLSGETTAAGRNRVQWVLNQNIDVFVLELGANDGLRGIPVEETEKNLQAIINTVREKNPETEIILAGMQIPPNLGREYAAEFRQVFFDLAEKNNVELIPFLLEGVAGNPELNQGDGIHPTAEGYEIVAENVWEILGPVVKE